MTGRVLRRMYLTRRARFGLNMEQRGLGAITMLKPGLIEQQDAEV